VNNFAIHTPPDKEPTLTVVYGEYLIDESGAVLSRKDQIAVLSASKQQMIDMLPENNEYKLPTFTGLYNGLKGLFDDQFKVHFSGLFDQK